MYSLRPLSAYIQDDSETGHDIPDSLIVLEADSVVHPSRESRATAQEIDENPSASRAEESEEEKNVELFSKVERVSLLLSLRNEQKETKPAIKHTAPPPVSFPGEPLAIASPSTGSLQGTESQVEAASYWPHLRLGIVIACFNGPTQWELLELATTTTQHVLELATNSYSGVAVLATLESEGHQLKNNEGANATDLQFVYILPFLPLSSPLVVPHRRLFHPHCCHGQPHTNGFAFGTDCTDSSSDSPSAASLAAGGSAAVPRLLGIALVANKPMAGHYPNVLPPHRQPLSPRLLLRNGDHCTDSYPFFKPSPMLQNSQVFQGAQS
ncbi:hypothetical protein B0H13DRAFT_2472030 [Mycena leptocephala]|nr:hypothetical protein B0H13DRAFT_2472030 [Mycena leptocephala]